MRTNWARAPEGSFRLGPGSRCVADPSSPVLGPFASQVPGPDLIRFLALSMKVGSWVPVVAGPIDYSVLGPRSSLDRQNVLRHVVFVLPSQFV